MTGCEKRYAPLGKVTFPLHVVITFRVVGYPTPRTLRDRLTQSSCSPFCR